MKFYWTDDQLNVCDDGVVTSYAPPGGPPSGGATAVALLSEDGAGGIYAFGVTERRGTFPNTFDAMGWHTAGDLTVLDDFWMPEDVDGPLAFPNGDILVGAYFITAYEGDGAHYDPVTGHLYLTGVWRRNKIGRASCRERG